MSRNEGVELLSLVSHVRTLKIRIEGYRQHILESEKSYKEHLDRLETKNVELTDALLECTNNYWKKCEKLKIAVEALKVITEISYYHDYGDHRRLASEALAAINGEH